MTLENKREAIKQFSKFAKVFITAERELPADLEKYRIRIPVDKIHDCIFYSTLLFGESATMASEAAVLGTPSIFIDNDGRDYTEEEKKIYGLVYNFTESAEDQKKEIQTTISILKNDNSKKTYHSKREVLLKDKIDTTAFMVS